MINTIKNTISQTINGTTKWRNHVNNVFKEFSGNGLGKRKADELAAAMLKIGSVNEYWSLSSTTPKATVEAIEEKVSQLCNRTHDNVYGDGYYDFCYPIFSAPFNNAWLPDDEKEAGEGQTFYLMLVTTVEFNQDKQKINIRQSIKAHDTYSGEFRAAISPGLRNTEHLYCHDFEDRHNLNVGQPLEEAIERLFNADAKKFGDVQRSYMYLLKNEEQGTNHHVNKEHIYISVVRNIQTMEYDRLVEALGAVPTMDFTSSSSHCALFDGNIAFSQYAS